MHDFIPGKVVNTFVSKKGHKVVIRYPTTADIPSLTKFVNEISREDIYISFSGEQLNQEDEEKFLENTIEKIKQGEKVFLCAEINGDIVATAHIQQVQRYRKRSLHAGELGIMIAKKYRNIGIGWQLACTLIKEAQRNIHDLSIITLSFVEANSDARALYTKLGFKKIGVLPKGFRRKGKYYDMQYMYLEL